MKVFVHFFQKVAGFKGEQPLKKNMCGGEILHGYKGKNGKNKEFL